MMSILVFLLSLPVCVWILASACAVIDEPQPARALVRLIAEICVLVALLLVTERDYIYPLAFAMFTVITLHVTAHTLVLRRGTGVPVYEQVPPPNAAPQDALEDEETQEPGP
jgi:hypothetical protein